MSIRRVYGDFTSQNLANWKEVCIQHNIQPIQQFRNTIGKNATDSALIIDAMNILYQHKDKLNGGFILISSDSDFTKLASRIRENNLKVVGIGKQETPESFINACSEFHFVENLGVNILSTKLSEKDKVVTKIVINDTLQKMKDELISELNTNLETKLNAKLDTINFTKNDLINEIKSKLKKELKNELKNKLKNELKSELEQELKSKQKQKLKDNLDNQLPLNYALNDTFKTIYNYIIEFYNTDTKKKSDWSLITLFAAYMRTKISNFSLKNFGVTTFAKFIKKYGNNNVIIEKDRYKLKGK